ncbi:hypothetical protein V8D89_001205 [Ganoderma adspersum]
MLDLLGTRGVQTSHVQVVGAPARGHQSSPTSTSTSTSTSSKARIGPRLTIEEFIGDGTVPVIVAPQALDPAIGSPVFHALVMSENKTRARLLPHSDLHSELECGGESIRAIIYAFNRVVPCHEEGRGAAREAAKRELEEAGKTSVLGDLWGNDKDEKMLLDEHTITVEFQHNLRLGGRAFSIDAEVRMSGSQVQLDSAPDSDQADRHTVSWWDEIEWETELDDKQVWLSAAGAGTLTVDFRLAFAGLGYYVLRADVLSDAPPASSAVDPAVNQEEEGERNPL